MNKKYYFHKYESQNHLAIFSVKKYTKSHKTLWNDFVMHSKNATFLFYRNFMEYHQDRFQDESLLIFKEKKLIALFPANRVEDKVYSHQGLTYGGLLLDKTAKFKDVLKATKALLKYFQTTNITTFIVKETPSIYHKLPSDEFNYLSFIMNGKLVKRDTLSVIDLKNKNSFSKDRLQGVKRGKRHELMIKEVEVFDEFWKNILMPNLDDKHNVKPVHTLEEITLLKSRFPEHIRQFNVYKNNTIVAGTTIFETDQVAHSQYISANNEKNALGSLDVLHDHLINKVFAKKMYFDFGISNENQGRNINRGLQYWKEGFGARTITQDVYEIETKYWNLLNSVLI